MFQSIRNFFTQGIQRKLRVLFTFVLLFVVIGFVEKKQRAKACNEVTIFIENAYDNYFINDADVLALLTKNGSEPLVGELYKNIRLKNLESRLKTNKFVKSCRVSRDLTGKLRVEVQQRRPVARIVYRYAPDAYVSEQGEILPLSARFTARVVLLEGAYLNQFQEQELTDSEAGRSLLELVRFIDGHKFWKAQIAEIHVDGTGFVTMHPQIGREVIEFGTATDVEKRFTKLMVFYKEILPVQGWNRYSRVSLAYQNQIICE